MGHTHDGIDWTTRLAALRRADDLEASVNQNVADRLVGLLDHQPRPVVVDLGAGAGGMSAALAGALGGRDGGRVVLVDAVPDLLDAATTHTATIAAGTSATVEVEPVQVDAASEQLAELLPAADLVWASRVVHHLPDQQRAIERLTDVLAPGGWLALGEGGLRTRCLPWDLGIGEPGLADRLTAARDEWFVRMRSEMPDAVRLPVGWNRALSDAGLTDVFSFSYLIDLPAPADEAVRLSVVDWLTWMSDVGDDALNESDRRAITRLLDPADDAYVGNRDDVFLLGASTVYLGRKAR